jgi:hypothetical protein
MEDYKIGNKGQYAPRSTFGFGRRSMFAASPASSFFGSNHLFTAPPLHSAYPFGLPLETAASSTIGSTASAAVPGSFRALCTPKVKLALQCKLCVIKTTAEHAAAAATAAPQSTKVMPYDARFYEGEPNDHWSALHDQLVRAVWRAYEQELGVAGL